MMECYLQTMRYWVKTAVKEPHEMMMISAVFCALSLPLFTIGLAGAVCLEMSKDIIEGKKVNYLQQLSQSLKKHFRNGILMFLIDLLTLLMMLTSINVVFGRDAGNFIKYIHLFLTVIDLIVLYSALYRYPIMIFNRLKIREIIVAGVLLTLNNFGGVLLVTGVIVTFAFLNALTLLGVLLLFPGGVLILSVYFYKFTVTKYISKQHSAVTGLHVNES